MFRARRMMALTELVERVQAERSQRSAEERTVAANIGKVAADEEATMVLNIAAVLKHLQVDRIGHDCSGVQVLGSEAASRGESVLICSADPDDASSELIHGPWLPDSPAAAPAILEADEESSVVRGPWTVPVEHIVLAPGELAAAILEADEESSEIIPGPWMADEEATCVYDQAALEALLRGR